MDFSKLSGFRPQPDLVRDEIKELIRRGNIAIAEFEGLRMNSYERDAIIPAMSRELLIQQTVYTIKNCSPFSHGRCAATYDEALQLFAAELAKRMSVKSSTAPITASRLRDIAHMICPVLSTNDVAADASEDLDRLAVWIDEVGTK